MENLISSENYLSAVGRLYQYSMNKRHHVYANELVRDDIGKIAVYINDLIKNKYYVDIFSASSIESIERYESYLNKTLIDYTSRNIAQRDITDEELIITTSKAVDSNELEGKTIKVSTSLPGINDPFPLNENELIELCKSPLSLERYQAHTSNSITRYFLINSTTINKSIYYVVFHLSYEIKNENNLTIYSAFIMPEETGIKYVDNPTRAFLTCLDIYGVDLEINGHDKKLFGLEIVKLNSKPYNMIDYIKFKGEKTGKISYSFNVRNTDENTLELEFVYGTEVSKYEEYLRKLTRNTGL